MTHVGNIWIGPWTNFPPYMDHTLYKSHIKTDDTYLEICIVSLMHIRQFLPLREWKNLAGSRSSISM